MARDLVTAHEGSEASHDNLTVLGSDEGTLDRINDRQDNNALELRERGLEYHAGNEQKDYALRIRELEVVARLAAESLERAGDDATAEVVRSVLRNGAG